MTPPVLLLDVMDTLVRDPFFEDVPAFFGLSLRDYVRQKDPDVWHQFERGLVTEQEYYARMFTDGRPVDGAGLRRVLHHGYRYLDGIEPLLVDLARRGCRMYALSNYPVWYELLEAKLGLSRFLSWQTVSCRTGHRKPDPAAYRGAALLAGVEPSACVFVDDRPDNCRAARDVGMTAFEYVNANQLRAALAPWLGWAVPTR